MRRSLMALMPGLMIAVTECSQAEQMTPQPASQQVSLPVSSNKGPSVTSAGLVRMVEESATEPIANLAVIGQAPANATERGILAPSSIDPTQSSPFTNTKPIELAPLLTPNTNIHGIGTGVHPTDVTDGRLPNPEWLPTGQTRHGEWSLQAKPWVPGGFCHQPLYFEDPMLERHGHERFPYFQPFVSGARFYGTFPVFPYLLTLRHPLDEVHTLGAYRPGTPAPMLRYRPHYQTVHE